jgi:hypothetical protein
MGAIFLKTLIMFVLAFIIAMFVSLLIYWIRNMLTSVRIASFFDEKSKVIVRRAQRIHKIHVGNISVISGKVEQEMHPELFDFYKGVNEEFVQPEDYYGVPNPIIRKKQSSKKHKTASKS